MKTGSPSVAVTVFPCAVCGARLDRLHLDPGPDGSFICSFCGAPQPHRNGNVSREGDSDRLNHASLVEASDVLREARERRGESLEEVAGATGINPRYLEDLECGDATFEPYPGRVYGRFFLREYAEHLGLDPEPIVEAFDGETGPIQPAEPPAISFIETPRRPFPWSLFAILALIVLLVGAGGFRLTRDDLPARRSGVPPASTQLDATPPGASEQPPAREAPERGIRAVIHVSGRCWIEAISDGTTKLAATKEAGTVVRLRADRRLELTLGNAGGVRLFVNGERVATGSTGDVVHLELVLRGNEVTSSPA